MNVDSTLIQFAPFKWYKHVKGGDISLETMLWIQFGMIMFSILFYIVTTATDADSVRHKQIKRWQKWAGYSASIASGIILQFLSYFIIADEAIIIVNCIGFVIMCVVVCSGDFNSPGGFIFNSVIDYYVKKEYKYILSDEYQKSYNELINFKI